jgi:transposase InsO family protein
LLRLILDTPEITELSVAQQRYQAVLAVISGGLSNCQVASKVGVSRRTLHSWLARYEAEGLEGLKALSRGGMIDPNARDRRSRKWKRWERGAPMELWQMDIVGGFALADGTSAKALTGIDDHSRMCVCARLMNRERTRAVYDGLRDALARFGAPEQILTDNGRSATPTSS